MNTISIIALVVGGLIIAGLSFYLGRLLLLIKQGKIKREQTLQADINQRNKTLSESIHTIAWAMRDGQCEYGEGCLRIWVLLDHYVEQKVEQNAEQSKTNNNEIYPGIFKLYDKIKEMPTHEARKKYSKKEIHKMDKQREGYEVEFKSLIEQDIAKLIERFGH